jgi:hypothetical protein
MSTRDGVSFPTLCRIHRLPEPVPEYKFALARGRNWRFDWAWPRRSVALEVDGGVWVGGRHTSGSGFLEDMAKFNEAAVLGWLLIRCIPKDLTADTTFELIRRALDSRMPI